MAMAKSVTSRTGRAPGPAGKGRRGTPDKARRMPTVSAPNPSANTVSNSPKPDEAGNVDKIRDILFGNQMKDYDAKFARLEASLKADAGELGDDLKQRLASLESFVKGELGAVTEQLESEKEVRSQGELRDSLTHRQHLAEILAQMAIQLRGTEPTSGSGEMPGLWSSARCRRMPRVRRQANRSGRASRS